MQLMSYGVYNINCERKLTKKEISTNCCSFKNLKRKKLVPVHYNQSKYNFCLRRRRTIDHECGTQSAVNH
uniref:Uncharacterized protein n=1 Tax=Glossina brevipalpis TaxID=37001 RepID=A0A1A9WL50_9MUSC